MPAIKNLAESFSVYKKNLPRFITAAVVFSVTNFIIIGAILGILILAFDALLLAGLVESAISLYILSALALVLTIILACFLNTFRAGFYDSCYSIYLARRQTPVDYLSYSLHRFPTYAMITLIQLFILALITVPIIAVNVFVANDILRYASILVFLIASALISAPFILAVTAVVVDNVGWAEALKRAIKTLFANFPQFVLLLLITSALQTLLMLIPVIGLLAVFLVMLPVSDSAFVMFYRSRRKA